MQIGDHQVRRACATVGFKFPGVIKRSVSMQAVELTALRVVPSSGRITVCHGGRTVQSLLALPPAPLREAADLPQVRTEMVAERDHCSDVSTEVPPNIDFVRSVVQRICSHRHTRKIRHGIHYLWCKIPRCFSCLIVEFLEGENAACWHSTCACLITVGMQGLR